MVNDVIYAPEVVGCLDYIIHVYRFICYADCVGLEDVSGLFVCELVAFDMIRVVCEVNLGTMVYGETFSFVLTGAVASVGMFQVFPVKNAPGIFPTVHQLRTVLSESPFASAYCLTDKYSIPILDYRQVFCHISLQI